MRISYLLIGIVVGMILMQSLPILSVDKSGYRVIAKYKVFTRIYTPYELDMLCK